MYPTSRVKQILDLNPSSNANSQLSRLLNLRQPSFYSRILILVATLPAGVHPVSRAVCHLSLLSLPLPSLRLLFSSPPKLSTRSLLVTTQFRNPKSHLFRSRHVCTELPVLPASTTGKFAPAISRPVPILITNSNQSENVGRGLPPSRLKVGWMDTGVVLVERRLGIGSAVPRKTVRSERTARHLRLGRPTYSRTMSRYTSGQDSTFACSPNNNIARLLLLFRFSLCHVHPKHLNFMFKLEQLESDPRPTP
ncbi:hypothetical protein B0H12DRAFT_87384 [Mycena haematopus]|nr:hypothetical protein B0H12DRAFT_87384 [Mycena haematopus]